MLFVAQPKPKLLSGLLSLMDGATGKCACHKGMRANGESAGMGSLLGDDSTYLTDADLAALNASIDNVGPNQSGDYNDSYGNTYELDPNGTGNLVLTNVGAVQSSPIIGSTPALGSNSIVPAGTSLLQSLANFFTGSSSSAAKTTAGTTAASTTSSSILLWGGILLGGAVLISLAKK